VIRRTPYAFFYLEDAGGVRTPGDRPDRAGAPGVLALAILTGQQCRLGREEFDLLAALPAERWVDADGLDPDALRSLAEMGLVVTDSDVGRLAALRARDEALSTNEWNLYAAVYHFMTQWSGVHTWDEGQDDAELSAQTGAAALSARTRKVARAFSAAHGPPPAEAAPIQSDFELPLPGQSREGALYRALTNRRTTRAFDASTPMTLTELDTVLRYVFGSHGYGRNVADVMCIKRTSPSGGGLHPIDVYPIITDVDGVPAGIYHYNVREHALARLSKLQPSEGRNLATKFMCGQRHFGVAHVSFVMTARFYRNHWKYRRHQKAYAGIIMDAAHLSQTLYLVAAELGLGAFITIAINSRDIERRLELDGVSEGVIAITGCGPRAPGQSPLELQFAPDATGARAQRVPTDAELAEDD
jgi:putative peptide maturation dehydrogenase